MRAPAALLLPLVLLSSAASAQAPARPEMPSLQPSRDVAVTYRVSGAGPEAREMRVAWLASAGLSRMEPPGAPGWILVERQPARATMVVDSQLTFMRLPPHLAAGMALDLPAGAELARAGEDRVAGQPCTIWQAGRAHGRARLCVTADGLLLRSVSPLPHGGENRLEAVSVRYGAQDAARFRIPQGYSARTAPGPLIPERR
ncbi:hypothetical protein J8J14_16080 [Roseomonas sp. SSH11]|uniref:DUF4412 domain-containing protein n=1 Tax=Pararoseomonas baculiformis TaxID=2820812 RepID=A0ABS4AGY4_9PROT|nr:hypothetical protein [Pararoseomonas baculiformis]MBP0446292.1 hypothetical protein [Pararoseomonas baculiformis]